MGGLFQSRLSHKTAAFLLNDCGRCHLVFSGSPVLRQHCQKWYATQKDDLSVNPFLRTKGKLTYYKKVRRDLEEAFRKFPKDTRLLSVFPRSEWVKTDHALLGIVYENGQPRYLCVAAEKNGAPPDDMKENCVFVPESPFTEERGFYIVFQDADSGAYVKTADA